MPPTSVSKPSSRPAAVARGTEATGSKHNVGALRSLVGFAVRSMHQYLSDGLSEVVQEDGLKPHQFTALSLIVDNPTISQSELARALGIKPSNIVQLIDEMEALQLVRRTPAEGTRRSYALVATKRGVRLRDGTLTRIARFEDRLLTLYTPQERATLLGLLERVYDR